MPKNKRSRVIKKHATKVRGGKRSRALSNEKNLSIMRGMEKIKGLLAKANGAFSDLPKNYFERILYRRYLVELQKHYEQEKKLQQQNNDLKGWTI